MNEPWAVVVSGIGGALIAGFIGIVSAIISYRIANFQLKNQMEENRRNREHQLYLLIATRKQQAIEDIWKLLFVLERTGKLVEEHLDIYIRSLMWLPSDIRELCLGLLQELSSSKTAGTQKSSLEIKALREKLIHLANFAEPSLNNHKEAKK